ncbi:ATP-binding protein [Streptomyces sp. SID685]|uniref:ATP-binding protein n=1 Tax=Streptomyces sp. SID685 TaxID=2690322 RepID=UPI001F2F2CBB|nr:ATP-binding protein [Streptomyces sp. SID685]
MIEDEESIIPGRRIGQQDVAVGGTVADFTRALPVPYAPKDDEEGGRGLALVVALAANWGADERRWGKVVWAELEARG